ncbi:MAG: hypothetical protein ABR591_13745 [Candidatus Velthaea sp.]
MIDAERLSAVALAAVALAALVLSLGLAFASALRWNPGANGDRAPRAIARTRPSAPAQLKTAAARGVTPAVAATAASTASVADAMRVKDVKPQSLWTLLTPWALTADVLGALGMAAVLGLRHVARRRRGRS